MGFEWCPARSTGGRRSGARPSLLFPLLGGGQGPASPRVLVPVPFFKSNYPTQQLLCFSFSNADLAHAKRAFSLLLHNKKCVPLLACNLVDVFGRWPVALVFLDDRESTYIIHFLSSKEKRITSRYSFLYMKCVEASHVNLAWSEMVKFDHHANLL